MPPQVLTGLAVALRDDNLRVRAEAINLASLLGPVCVLRRKPATSCAQIGNALIDNINSRDALLRRAAMQALGQLRYPNAVQALSDQFSYYQKGPDAMAALEGLAGIGHPTSVSVFEAVADELERRHAAPRRRRAGARGRSRCAAELQQMGQTERSSGVLLALHYANVKLGADGSSLQQLVAALSNASQRPLALKYLLDLAPSMAPALAESLKDPKPGRAAPHGRCPRVLARRERHPGARGRGEGSRSRRRALPPSGPSSGSSS